MLPSDKTGCTFAEWLFRQRGRNDPVGDLSRDVEKDTYFSVAASGMFSLSEWIEYLDIRHASPKVYVALGRAWAEYNNRPIKLTNAEIVALLERE